MWVLLHRCVPLTIVGVCTTHLEKDAQVKFSSFPQKNRGVNIQNILEVSPP